MTMVIRRRRIGGMGTSILVVLACLLVGACDEEGMVQVSKIRFEGVLSVPEDELRNALATRQSSWIPWGRKRYFDRAQLDADLRRIRAFYADRGYPEARVAGFDVQLNDEQSQVDVTLTIEEGEPVRIAAIDYYGFWEVPEEELDRIRNELPFKVGDIRNRRTMVATERAVETSLHDTASRLPVVDHRDGNRPARAGHFDYRRSGSAGPLRPDRNQRQ